MPCRPGLTLIHNQCAKIFNQLTWMQFWISIENVEFAKQALAMEPGLQGKYPRLQSQFLRGTDLRSRAEALWQKTSTSRQDDPVRRNSNTHQTIDSISSHLWLLWSVWSWPFRWYQFKMTINIDGHLKDFRLIIQILNSLMSLRSGCTMYSPNYPNFTLRSLRNNRALLDSAPTRAIA